VRDRDTELVHFDEYAELRSERDASSGYGTKSNPTLKAVFGTTANTKRNWRQFLGL
jgi:hypothetical protein